MRLLLLLVSPSMLAGVLLAKVPLNFSKRFTTPMHNVSFKLPYKAPEHRPHKLVDPKPKLDVSKPSLGDFEPASSTEEDEELGSSRTSSDSGSHSADEPDLVGDAGEPTLEDTEAKEEDIETERELPEGEGGEQLPEDLGEPNEEEASDEPGQDEASEPGHDEASQLSVPGPIAIPGDVSENKTDIPKQKERDVSDAKVVKPELKHLKAAEDVSESSEPGEEEELPINENESEEEENASKPKSEKEQDTDEIKVSEGEPEEEESEKDAKAPLGRGPFRHRRRKAVGRAVASSIKVLICTPRTYFTWHWT